MSFTIFRMIKVKTFQTNQEQIYYLSNYSFIKCDTQAMEQASCLVNMHLLQPQFHCSRNQAFIN